MADENLDEFPTGQLQIAGSDLQFAASCKVNSKNNAKLVHTMRQSPAGVVRGVNDLDGTVETVVSIDGVEHDYLSWLDTGKRIQLRFKPPGNRIVVEGVLTSVDFDLPLGDTVKCNLGFIGKRVKV